MMTKVIPEHYYYLASPYSHPNASVRFEREIEISYVGAQLTHLGLNLFCPITQSVRLNDFLNKHNQLGHDECMRVDYAFLARAKGLIVAMVDGWKESKGVALEIQFAQDRKMPIYFLAPNGDLEDFVKMIMQKEQRESRAHGDAVEQYYQQKEEEEVHKGASKEGKPSIMNFPWLSLDTREARLMNGLIAAYLDKNEEQYKAHLTELYDQLDDAPQGEKLLNVLPIFEQGREKHSLRSHLNYTREDSELLINALGRHILKGISNIDQESGFPHRQHAIANVLMLLQILNKGDSK